MKIIIIQRIGSLFLGLLCIPIHGWSSVDMTIKVVLVDFSDTTDFIKSDQPSPVEDAEDDLFDTLGKMVLFQPVFPKRIAPNPIYDFYDCELELQLKEVSWRQKFLVLW